MAMKDVDKMTFKIYPKIDVNYCKNTLSYLSFGGGFIRLTFFLRHLSTLNATSVVDRSHIYLVRLPPK